MKRVVRLAVVARLAALVAVLLLGGVLAAPSAQAWWRGGFGFGFVPYVPAPHYVVPYYYAPPPVYYVPPPAYGAPAPGQTCYAGPYICPLAQPSAINAPCSCPMNDGGRAGGRVG